MGRINKGANRYGAQRSTFERNRKIVMQTQSICYLCGQPVDFTIKPPDFFSPAVDHIIPLARGGSNELTNLMLTHRGCNLKKSSHLLTGDAHERKERKTMIANRNLPLSCDWSQA